MSQEKQLAKLWQKYNTTLVKGMEDAFINHAIDNRGMLTSTRRKDAVVNEMNQLLGDYITGNCDQADVIVAATELANQGLAMVSGTALMRAVGTGEWIETADPQLRLTLSQKLLDFQLLFLEKLSSALILIQQRTQERSQKALQDALHSQIKQQREMRHEQEVYNSAAAKILALNAHLASITDETELLEQAINGIYQALDLANTTLYDLSSPEQHWSIRTTTDEHIRPYDVVSVPTLQLLNKALAENGLIQYQQIADNHSQLLAILLIQSGENTLGAVLFNSNPLPEYQIVHVPILLRTFTQNLASHWYNLQLFAETKQRSLEMEILYGRYIDSIWNPETAALQASYKHSNFQISREPHKTPPTDKAHSVPIIISNHPIGHISLPDNVSLDPDREIFVQELIREMGNALNNAYLLQTTRTTSNQLNLATEVSRAATTILDREMLSREVVELIRSRFDFYYVGHFLIDE